MSQEETMEEQAVKNPSYDKTLSVHKRMSDFLGAYHLVLHGVNAHEPFYLKNEGHPERRCDTDDKEAFIKFVELLVNDQLSLHHEADCREFEKVIGEDETKHGDFCFPNENEPCICGMDYRNDLRSKYRLALEKMKEGK